MSTRAKRVVFSWAVLPLFTMLLLVRPATGQESLFGLFALTATGGAVVLEGDIGAGGGLAVLDGGVPFVSGRLDSSPSSSVRAAAIEPGALVRTVVGVVNTEADQEVITVTSADAEFPGEGQESNGDLLGAIDEPPMRLGGLTAHAVAHQEDMAGFAELGSARVEGLFHVEGATTTISAEAAPGAGELISTVTSRVGRIDIAGVVALEEVVGIATTTVADGERIAEAVLRVGRAEVGGVPVEITSDGVVVDGDALADAGPFRDLQEQVNIVLDAAGIDMTAISPRQETDGRSALADAGGVRISISTAPNEAVPGNVVVLTLATAVATSADEPPFVFTPSVPPSTGNDTVISPPAVSSGPTIGSSPSVSVAEPAAPAPAVAAPASNTGTAADLQPQLILAGRRLPARAVLAIFGGWQLLTLSTCTLAAWSLK